ncbi:hypothetical protein OpiT1DRAFT_00112 [Opitutaceae bacterium TAV1]|nr:hypothetical protein OpiT1DRAFT_00112 [Opitutaceae bacterium TAV1]
MPPACRLPGIPAAGAANRKYINRKPKITTW